MAFRQKNNNMANFVFNHIFIKGTKQSIVDFINRGLKGCNSKVRISADLSGEQIADRLNGHGCPINMQSYQSIGISENAPLDLWKVRYKTDEGLCLSFQLIDAFEDPTPFLRYINGFDGITVYAYGFDSPFYSSWYQYNGQKNEVLKQNVMEKLNATDSEATYKILEGYVQDFLKELDKA